MNIGEEKRIVIAEPVEAPAEPAPVEAPPIYQFEAHLWCRCKRCRPPVDDAAERRLARLRRMHHLYYRRRVR